MKYLRRKSSFPTCCLVSLLTVASGRLLQAQDDPRMKQIVVKVRENEKLYRNLEVVMQTTYELGRSPESPYSVTNSTARARFVVQGNEFRFELKALLVSPQGLTNKKIELAGDGVRTRNSSQYVYPKRPVMSRGTISDRQQNQMRELIRPHLLTLRAGSIGWLFHDFYQHVYDDEEDLTPELSLSEKLQKHYKYLGVENYAGLKCHKVRRISETSEPADRFEADFWLAEDRNYLPVKWQIVAEEVSKTLPLRTGEVKSFEELKPGLWYPKEVEIRIFEEFTLEKEQRHETPERYLHKIESVKLNPGRPAEYFHHVTFPDGTEMREYQHGEQIRFWIQGE